jgi:hypothetical protein
MTTDTETPRQKLLRAQELLREARDLCIQADAPRTTARVRGAITSVGGAIRHAIGRELNGRGIGALLNEGSRP